MSFRFDCPYPSRRSPVMAGNVVATSQPLAAQAGLLMLQRGGNAVDAALAAAAALTVVEPTGNGLGSDAFAIVWDGERLHGLNASGRAPAAWDTERFRGRTRMPERGWESVTVPGAVSAWRALSERFGALPFSEWLQPAIRYAHEGFLVTPVVARRWQADARRLHGQPGFAEAFMPNGRAPAAGEVFACPALGSSLADIAQTRGETFYRGRLAERMAAAAAGHGAALTAEDLARHEPAWCTPLSQAFRGAALHEIPPNGQGLAALIALGLLERTDLHRHPVDSAAAIHLQIEAMKLALADVYRYVGDPHGMPVSAEALLAPGYLDTRARLIDPDRAGEPGHGIPGSGGTVYLSTADAAGRMVSFIQSNYMGFGSGVVVPETGISLQNRGAGFRLEPGHPNCVGPGKRPFHTIIPGFVTADGGPAMSFGVMGGAMQAQGHVQMVVRTVLYGQNPQAACDAPRWRVGAGRCVALEDPQRAEVRDGLHRRGHALSEEAPGTGSGFGGAQIVARTGGGYIAGSDPRKDGHAVGY